MQQKTNWFSRGVFRFVRWTVRVIYGKTDIEGLDRIPERDAVIVANHTQMNGPIVGELFMPMHCYTWCAGQMMHLKEVPQYAFSDFWSQKPRWTRPLYRALSYLIAPLAACIFSNARTVAVYRDHRVLSTFRESVNHLKDGDLLLIFPEKDETYNNILYRFQENFVDVARLYHKKTGRELVFVPMYVAPTLHKAYIGEGIRFHSDRPIEEERGAIVRYLSHTIADMARALPEHTVVPYRNIPRKYYLTNKDMTEVPYETACR